MSRLEPAIPQNVGDRFDAPGLDLGGGHDAPASIHSEGSQSKIWAKWRRAAGLFLLAVTIFGWTTTNFLASDVFADDTYAKPYFVTYINTTFFIIPLIPILIKKAYQNPEELRSWKEDIRSRLRRQYAPVKQEDGEAGSYHDSPVLRSNSLRTNIPGSNSLLEEEPLDRSQVLSAKDLLSAPLNATNAPLSLPEIAKLSLEFCMLWFLANYFVAACLQYTTVASSTILTSTSSVFTLLFGAIFKVERFTVRKLLGVLASLAGIIIISSLDLSGKNNDDEHRGDFPSKTLKERAIGDILAFLSAVMYGLYAVFMKKRIGDESRVDMPVFFGFVGIINVLILWPGLIIFHWTGIETFEWPPTWGVVLIIFCNSLGSLISDMAWAYAVLLTSPIVVTVGLSLTIPLSLVGQVVLNDQTAGVWKESTTTHAPSQYQTAGVWYWLGACVVVLSFLFVNHEEKKDDDEVPSIIPITEDTNASEHNTVP